MSSLSFKEESLGQTSKKVSKSSKSKDTSIKLFDEQRAYFNHSFHLPSVLIKSVHVIYLVSSDTHSSNNMWINICLLNGEEGSLRSKTNSYSRLSQSAQPALQGFQSIGEGKGFRGAREPRRLQST